MDEFFFNLDCEVTGWKAGTVDVTLNGIPLVTLGAGRPASFSDLVNEYLLAGENTILLEAHKLALTPWDDIPQQQSARAIAKLTRYPFGGISGGPDGVLIGQVEWKMPELADLKVEEIPALFPQQAIGKIDAGPRPGRPWRWEAAAPLEPGEPLNEEVLSFLKPIHEALQAGDPKPFLAAANMRFEDLEAAYASFDSEERKDLIRKSTKPGGMQPFLPEAFLPRLCAENKLLDCRAVDGDPFLREIPGPDGTGFFEMYLAKIEGQFQIVR